MWLLCYSHALHFMVSIANERETSAIHFAESRKVGGGNGDVFIKKYKMMSVAFAFSVLSGCGTVVPEIQELPGSPNDGDLLVKEIVRRVHCEVQDAVQNVILTDEHLAAQGQ